MPSQTIGAINPTGFAQPFRDQFTPAEERAQDEAQAWAEKTEDWETCPVCNGHGQPEGDGHGWDGSSFHTPGCDFCDGMGAVPEDAFLLALVAEGGS